jgi:hypothetical protein
MDGDGKAHVLGNHEDWEGMKELSNELEDCLPEPGVNQECFEGPPPPPDIKDLANRISHLEGALERLGGDPLLKKSKPDAALKEPEQG